MARTTNPAEVLWKSIRNEMRPMRAGELGKVVNGKYVKRLSSQKWMVNGTVYLSAYDATAAVFEPGAPVLVPNL